MSEKTMAKKRRACGDCRWFREYDMVGLYKECRRKMKEVVTEKACKYFEPNGG